MRKMITALSLVIVLIFAGCTSNAKSTLKGSYQSERNGIGYVIEISIQPEDSSYVEYIDNREVDKGTYEKSENNLYRMKSDKRNFQMALKNDNSFKIIIKKLNNGKPIQMKNISNIPSYSSMKYDDIDKYKALLD